MLLIATGALVYVLALGAIVLTRREHAVTALWPCCAVAFCIAARFGRSRRDQVMALSALFAGVAGANWISGQSIGFSTALGGINSGEVALALWIARRLKIDRLRTPAEGLAYAVLVGGIPPALGCIAAAAAVAAVRPAAVLETLISWYFGHLLGALLVGSFGMTFRSNTPRYLRLNARWKEAVALVLLVAVSALAVFSQTRLPLLFLAGPPLVLATYRFRLLGAAVGALVLTLVAVPLTAFGGGPIALAPDIGMTRVLVLQLFLASCSLTCIPMASALNDRDRKGRLLAREQARALQESQAKSELLSHVSHDIRSSLTAIMGFTKLMRHGGVAPEQAARFSQLILNNAEFLLALSDDLLDMAAIQAGAVAIHEGAVDLAGVLEQLAARFQADVRSELQIAPCPVGAKRVQADPIRLTQVLNNLISNGLKYGAGHGPVRVDVAAPADGFVRISVWNGGPGIAPEKAAQLFKPFSRLGAELSEVKGTGLGLVITKELVELQHGRIGMESDPGKQTCFWVELPVAESPAAAPELAPPEDRGPWPDLRSRGPGAPQSSPRPGLVPTALAS